MMSSQHCQSPLNSLWSVDINTKGKEWPHIFAQLDNIIDSLLPECSGAIPRFYLHFSINGSDLKFGLPPLTDIDALTLTTPACMTTQMDTGLSCVTPYLAQVLQA